MVMEGKVKIVCTSSEGCVSYETQSSTSASKQSPQSSASRLQYDGKAPIVIQSRSSVLGGRAGEAFGALPDQGGLA